MTKWTFGIQAIATQPIPTVPRINTCILAVAVLAFISLFRQRRKQIKMMLATKARVQNIKAVYTKHYIATYSKIFDLHRTKTIADGKIHYCADLETGNSAESIRYEARTLQSLAVSGV